MILLMNGLSNLFNLLTKALILFKVKFALYLVNSIVEVFRSDIFEPFTSYYIYTEELATSAGLLFCKFTGTLFF